MERTSGVIILALFLSSMMIGVKGCHNALDGTRKKRGAVTNANAVERTRPLRNFFANCMMERAGPMFDWDGVVDFSVLDTLWYERTNGEVCRNDTVRCWQNRLLDYLRPNSAVLPFARDCMTQLERERRATGRMQFRSRVKRGIGYPRPTTPPVSLLDRYANCVEGNVVLPQRRRNIAINSVVSFVEENAICGECSDITLHPQPTRPKPSSYNNHHSQSHRVARSARSSSSYSSSSSSGSTSFRNITSISSGILYYASSVASHVNITKHITPVLAAFPFTFQALTLDTSPLFSSIVTCNREFLNEFVSNGVPNIGWTSWSQWGECPASCGREAVQVRRRTCPLGVPGVPPCIGEAFRTRRCQRRDCFSWSNWEAWSPCHVTCGSQTVISRRRCLSLSNRAVRPESCGGSVRRMRMCNKGPCVGSWSNWGAWSVCSSSCGTGHQVRRRRCAGPNRCLPNGAGHEGSQRRPCRGYTCPGSWSDWESWSPCSVSCGSSHAYVRRRRRCNSVYNGGPGCRGSSSEKKPCGRHPCPAPQWAEWSTWSECAWKRQVRTCLGGSQASCTGSHVRYQPCNGCNNAAASWSQWGSWSACQGTCYYGSKRRQRHCNQGRSNTRCSGLNYQSRYCRPPRCLLLGK